ncbi:MAG: 30S ribosomal protein S4 [Candidatus Pacebacteria bacterium]|nr:30S ribosomal protein S4 [Candidatus Paceibacterota bacterium]
MIRGPKFKIARRLGAPIFEKTQNAKFQLVVEKKIGAKKPKAKSDYGLQMMEKQKARLTYGVSEKQFAKYVKTVIAKKSGSPINDLYESLELRLDNAIYRLGFGRTRSFTRQIVSHGHITVNGKKVTIPSYRVSKGDVVGIRNGSAANAIFKEIDDKTKDTAVPVWLAYDKAKHTATVVNMPKIEGAEMLFDLGAVLEFYKR